ncbi:hypothetical protein chiPu_0024717, partial [Chiloscyllium punctatum]|nr:hypothetical protein [Chiloscyllium punctatum]
WSLIVGWAGLGAREAGQGAVGGRGRGVGGVLKGRGSEPGAGVPREGRGHLVGSFRRRGLVPVGGSPAIGRRSRLRDTDPMRGSSGGGG